MIEVLDHTLRRLLMQELPVESGKVDIQFHRPNSDWSAKLTRPTVNLFLYDVRENAKLRHTAQGWDMERGSDGKAVQRRKPLRLDLRYLVTAWVADEPAEEHQLLGQVLIALFRSPELPEELLPESLRDQPSPITLEVAQHDTAENLSDLWNALGNSLRPAIFCTVTVPLNPYEPISTPVVRTRELRTQQPQPLFTIQPPLALADDAQGLPPDLRQKFAEHKIEFSEHVQVLPPSRYRADRWRIDDLAKAYVVVRTDQALEVYQEDTFWTIGGIIYLTGDTPLEELELALVEHALTPLPLTPESVLLFSAAPAYSAGLDQGKVSSDLRAEFKQAGHKLSDNLTILGTPSAWNIKDQADGKTYRAVLTGEGLAISRSAARFTAGNLRAGRYTLKLTIGRSDRGVKDRVTLGTRPINVPAPDYAFEIDDFSINQEVRRQ